MWWGVENNKNNYRLFKDYYELFMKSGDCDPAFPALNYVCDRYEFNLEQRYWIAFLYGMTYCAPTTFYIYNEFPDYENVSISRLKKWWKNNKEKCLFQTDRAKVKNFDLFPKIIKSYINTMGWSQEDSIKQNKGYEELYSFLSKIYYFGRFSLFNYTQALWELTNTKYEPTFFDLRQAESCRNGLCRAVNKMQYYTSKKNKVEVNYDELNKDFKKMMKDLNKKFSKMPVNIWNVETTLCAYKKLFLGKRYLGYYIDRQQGEIIDLQEKVDEGVDWDILWDFRSEFYDKSVLGEVNGWKGIRKSMMNIFKDFRKFGNEKEFKKYRRKVKFPKTKVYNYEI